MVCKTCGGRLIKDWGGWSHARKPERRHAVVPVAVANNREAE